MQTYKIYPLVTLTSSDIEMGALTYMHNFGKKVVTPCVLWLVIGNGRRILVDSGPYNAEKAAKYHHPASQTEDMLPQKLVRSVGVEPDEIDTIILTHLHYDHCCNLEMFPNATVYVQRKEVEYAINPLPPHYLFYEAPKIGMQAPWITQMTRFTFVDGDFTLCDGIEVYLMPGHTPGIQNVAVNTTNGIYLIATDNIPLFKNWEGEGWHKHIISGIHVNLYDYYKSLERMEKVCDHVLPGHDISILNYKVFPPEN
jgi:glyoxylase-like metal-dependent hydrolase (beta-lactamase superfamily II)